MLSYSADARCSGRRECKIRIPDQEMDNISVCPKDLGRYLEATYDCEPGKMSITSVPLCGMVFWSVFGD